MEIIIVILTVFLLLSLFAIWIVYQNMVDYKDMYIRSLVEEDESRFESIQPRLIITKEKMKRISNRSLARYSDSGLYDNSSSSDSSINSCD